MGSDCRQGGREEVEGRGLREYMAEFMRFISTPPHETTAMKKKRKKKNRSLDSMKSNCGVEKEL